MRRMMFILAIAALLGGVRVHTALTAEQTPVCMVACDPSDCDPKDCVPCPLPCAGNDR